MPRHPFIDEPGLRAKLARSQPTVQFPADSTCVRDDRTSSGYPDADHEEF